MPFTVNGFGTRYVGRKNEESRQGYCDSCKREVTLTSYDTRLCICALFIPIVPLGRKRIIDECSRCRRHHAMPLADFDELVGEHRAATEAAYRASPGDAEAAIAYTEELARSATPEELDRQLSTLESTFAEDAEVIFYVAATHERLGQQERADRLFDRAFDLDRSYPPARHAKIVTFIQQGELGRAKSLALETPAEDRDPNLLFAIASAYDAEGDAMSAWECLRRLVEDYPGIAQVKPVRKLVRKTEKAVGATSTILPGRQLPWGRIALGAGLALAVAGGAVGYDLYQRGHQTLHVVNGYTAPLIVTIEGHPAVTAPPGERVEIEIAEGEHRATFSGLDLPPVGLDTRRGVVERFRESPTYVLNPGGLAVLLWEEVRYSARGNAGGGQGRFYAGQPFRAFAVDYAFEEFPESISTSRSGTISKTRVDFVPGGPDELAGPLLLFGADGAALDYLEAWLEIAPADLATTYAFAAASLGAGERATERLRAGLSLDPVDVEWHRAYQQAAASTAGGAEALRTEYDAHLGGRPDDAALLYLRGRIDPDPAAVRRYYENAVAAEPGQLYAVRALGYLELTLGRFDAAVATLRPLVEASAPETLDPQLDALYGRALHAAGAVDELASRLRERAQVDPLELDWTIPKRVVVALVGAGRGEAAEALVAELGELRGRLLDEPDQLLPYLRGVHRYATGDLKGLSSLAKGRELHPFVAAELRFWATAEGGDPVAASRAFEELTEDADHAFYQLVLSLVYQRAGLAGRAAELREEALERLARHEPSYRVALELLATGSAPTAGDLDRLMVEPRAKATILAILLEDLPGGAPTIEAELARFNFSLAFPHHLLAGPPPAEEG